jgi:hypothetical protein
LRFLAYETNSERTRLTDILSDSLANDISGLSAHVAPLSQRQAVEPWLLALDTARITLCAMPSRKPQEPQPSQTGMASHAENEASVIPHPLRDDSTSIICRAIAGLGGATKAGKVLGKATPTIWTYLYGSRRMPSDVAARLAEATAASANEQTALVHALKRIEAEAREREALKRLANRERYFQRFGRYPVPARGNKTP